MDERTALLHEMLDAMLERRPVWVRSMLGGWFATTVIEIRSSGTVAVHGKPPGARTGVVISREPGQIRLTNPLNNEETP